MAQTRTKAPSLRRTAAALWHSLAKDLFDPYRPELHYMRGPGPRWHAKHTQLANGTPELGSLHAA
jgi:hypothetical protein